MKKGFSEEKAKRRLESRYDEAGELLKSDKLDEFLLDIEEKLKNVNHVGEWLSHIPVFISMVKAFVSGNYKKIPSASLVAIVASLVYFLSPLDAIPDFIPGAGQIDDGAVVLFCLKLVDEDVKQYIAWRDNVLADTVGAEGRTADIIPASVDD